MNANYITAYLMPEMPIAASSLLLFSGLPFGGKTNETEMFRYAANSSQTVMYLLRSHRRPISSHGVPIPVFIFSANHRQRSVGLLRGFFRLRLTVALIVWSCMDAGCYL